MRNIERTKTKICMEIETCKECHFCIEERHWTSDSWEHVYDYFCELTPSIARNRGITMVKNNKKIAGYIEWDSEMPNVPNWCPLRVN